MSDQYSEFEQFCVLQLLNHSSDTASDDQKMNTSPARPSERFAVLLYFI